MVLVAPPASRTPRSARIHSMRVEERIAHVPSAGSPRARRPPEIARTRPWVSAQVSERHSVGPSPASERGYRKASASGVFPTRSRNSSGTLRGA